MIRKNLLRIMLESIMDAFPDDTADGNIFLFADFQDFFVVFRRQAEGPQYMCTQFFIVPVHFKRFHFYTSVEKF